MATSATKQVLENNQPVNPASLSSPDRRPPQTAKSYIPAMPDKKPTGYGLPCSHCHAYYPVDMQACPICRCAERVSATAAVHSALAASSQTAIAPPVDSERERLLKELKSQAFASHTQINPVATFQCVLSHQHTGSAEPAAVCHNCYSEVRQQADRMEAALHMDGKEAAKIVYDAVWADTSDPNASYFNAANALLSELRKRAGIAILLGTNKPLAH